MMLLNLLLKPLLVLAVLRTPAAIEHDMAANGWSVQDLVSLGHAYEQTGDRGHAVLAFERAHILAPRDGSVAASLAQAREQAGVAVASPSALDRAAAVLPSDAWAWLALSGLAVACAVVVLLAWTSRRRTSVALALAGAVVGSLTGYAAVRAAPRRGEAVVVSAEPARISPIPSADVAFAPRPGETVHVERRRGDQVYVRADHDHAGWMPAGAVELVVPDDRALSRS